MKKRTKITAALLLAVCMLVSFLPAAAAEETLLPAPAEAITEVSDTAVQKEVFRLDAECQILRHVDKEVLEAGKHVARLTAEEDLSSYVFLNEDGSRTVYYMDEPVKFMDGDGTVREKNIDLTATTGGYTTTQNDVQLTIPDDPASGIRLSHDGKSLSLIPQGGSISSPAEMTGDYVTYPDYFGEGISLRYTPTLSGVKEDILLDSYTGVNSFTFLLNTGGLNLYQANGRWFLAESKLAEDRIELGDIVAFDARGRFSLGTMTVETVMPGQSYRLTVTADEAFLTDENTTYPVSIDPTMEFSGTVSIEDVTIFSGSANTNGNWSYLHAGYYNDNYKVARTLFRLPGLTGSSVFCGPTGFRITSVKFHIREATGTAGVAVGLYANVGDTWSESGATWNNAGIEIGKQYATASPSYGNETVYDITQLVKDWQSGTKTAACGFVLKSSNETSVNKSFCSSENTATSFRPYVVMTYSYITEPITVNLDMMYDYAYGYRYAGASNRILTQLNALKKKYAAEFGIKINLATPTYSASYADAYCTTTPTQHCTHAENEACYRSILYVSGNTKLYTYHHNNYYNIMVRLPLPDTASTFRMAFCGHVTCYVSRDTDGNFVSHSTNPFLGLTFSEKGLSMITNFRSESSELKTVVHEFGHFYGVEDHYGGSQTSTKDMNAQIEGEDPFSEYCIYGEYRENSSVLEDLIICDGCKATIESNRSKWNHEQEGE